MNRIISFFVAAIMMLALNSNASDVVATYGDGKKITKAEVTKWVLAQTGGQMPEGKSSLSEVSKETREEIFKQYAVNQEVITLAEKSKIAQSDKYKQQIENARIGLLVRMYLDEYASKKINNSVLKAQYSKFVDVLKNSDDLEVSHIVVETEGEANDLYKQLKQGKKFNSLAKKHSKDETTKKNGGKLGVISKGQFNPTYERTAENLKKGAFSKPVQIESSWFIIKLDNRSKKKIPSFDEVKPQMEAMAKEEIVRKYIDDLAKTTKIKLAD